MNIEGMSKEDLATVVADLIREKARSNGAICEAMGMKPPYIYRFAKRIDGALQTLKRRGVIAFDRKRRVWDVSERAAIGTESDYERGRREERVAVVSWLYSKDRMHTDSIAVQLADGAHLKKAK